MRLTVVRQTKGSRAAGLSYWHCEALPYRMEYNTSMRAKYEGGIHHDLCYAINQSGDLPEWREFEVADIRQLKILSERCSGTRPALSGKHHKRHRVFASVSMPGEGCGCHEPK